MLIWKTTPRAGQNFNSHSHLLVYFSGNYLMIYECNPHVDNYHFSGNKIYALPGHITSGTHELINRKCCVLKQRYTLTDYFWSFFLQKESYSTVWDSQGWKKVCFWPVIYINLYIWLFLWENGFSRMLENVCYVGNLLPPPFPCEYQIAAPQSNHQRVCYFSSASVGER